jgi:hypothetical protein
LSGPGSTNGQGRLPRLTINKESGTLYLSNTISIAGTVLTYITSAGAIRTTGSIKTTALDGVAATLAIQPAATTTIGAVIRGASGQSADLFQIQSSAGTNVGGFGNTGNLKVRTTTEFSGALNVAAASSTQIGAVVRGAASQSANLQEWQSSAGTVLAFVRNDGVIRAPFVSTSSNFLFVGEQNSGGYLAMTKQTAAISNIGADRAGIYFRDGTNAGTLKLVVRAGTAGAETTILDNIPQT